MEAGRVPGRRVADKIEIDRKRVSESIYGESAIGDEYASSSVYAVSIVWTEDYYGTMAR